MCANYVPVSRLERLTAYFAAGNPAPFPEETFPSSPAPFVRSAGDDAPSGRELVVGRFGLLPHWARDAGFGRRTYNARAETAAEKPSFREAWARGRRCIVACEAIYEPRWDEGRAVRWRIGRRDAAPIGIAGLWNAWHAPGGDRLLSFTMLTVNADAHPLMRQFHRPGDEKRMVAMLDFDRFDDWLQAGPEHMRELLGCFPSEALQAEPAPLPPRARPHQRPLVAAPAAEGQAGAEAPRASVAPRSSEAVPPSLPAAPPASPSSLPLFPELD